MPILDKSNNQVDTTQAFPAQAFRENCAAFYQTIASERGLTTEFDGIAVAVTDIP